MVCSVCVGRIRWPAGLAGTAGWARARLVRWMRLTLSAVDEEPATADRYRAPGGRMTRCRNLELDQNVVSTCWVLNLHQNLLIALLFFPPIKTSTSQIETFVKV